MSEYQGRPVGRPRKAGGILRLATSIDRQESKPASAQPFARAESALYLDVIHIAIVYGERDLLELRFGSISPLDLNDLIASVLYSR
eukprot:COSAG06_NODE_39932_length_407_cov_0.883117_1_plen_85_part_01